ncbi:amidohydrolase family-domain-containing protein [Naematelia encephala]|uniref:Amidohydrolase family-domain-containing protein n=1 Tax=Naematelia encephala TaxID=71784 RepID=A0A1Y2ANP1_9TREE|nr:amidohydrolase family-domain-containing protein [Naematelia encephala]
MSDIRARRTATRMPISNEKTPLAPATERYRRTPPPPRRPTRSLSLSISLLILLGFVLYAQRRGKSGVSYSFDGKALPDWYALCSKEGKKVYTVPEEGGLGAVECVVVGNKEVAGSGSLARVRRRWGDKHEPTGQSGRRRGVPIIFLPPGHTLTPGFVDSHAHPLQYGHTRQLQLQGSRSIREIIERVETFVNGASLPRGAWVEGMGWDQNLWPVKEFPTAADLEASPVLAGLPIALARIDVHAEWVSPAVLDLMGELPDHVEGGQIVRYPNGSATGVFLDNAIDLINAVRPPWTDTQREAFLERMTKDGLSKGLTGVQDAQVPLEDAIFFKRMADKGKLGMRFYSMINCEDREAYCGDQIEKVHGAADGRLTIQAVKLFADGALGSRGAALLEDYADKPGWSGFLLNREETWEPLMRKWYENGWQVNVHTIGDKANHVVLNAIEKILGPNESRTAGRFRLEHAQIMRLDDITRAANLGVIGSYQPTHATSDMWYAEDRLGSDRIKGAYAWRTYLEHGGRITLGSDFPVESIDPLKGYYAAVTRLAEDGTSPHGPGGWYPEQKLTREEALRGFTVEPAQASFSNSTGSLTPGKRFDAVLWDDDLLEVDQEEMLDVRVVATIIDGKIVWGGIKSG